MQKKLRKGNSIADSNLSTEEILISLIEQTEKVVRGWEALSESGSDVKAIQSALGVSRATYYRKKKVLWNLDRGIFPPSKRPRTVRKPCWTDSDAQLVLRIRSENPTYGKEKIAAILKRDFGWNKSESTVGRILKCLMESGLVARSISASRTKKKRVFDKHAIPWTFKKYEEMTLGERVQVDHMTVTKNGLSFKHFQAWERIAKHLSAQIYCSAKSSDAKKFLLDCAIRN
jgi:predicted transcriptional regulator